MSKRYANVSISFQLEIDVVENESGIRVWRATSVTGDSSVFADGETPESAVENYKELRQREQRLITSPARKYEQKPKKVEVAKTEEKPVKKAEQKSFVKDEEVKRVEPESDKSDGKSEDGTGASKVVSKSKAKAKAKPKLSAEVE